MNNFKRILDLVRRTGDKLVVTDSDGEEAVVVMDLDEYELLLSEAGLFESDFDQDLVDDFDPAEIDFDPSTIDEDFMFEDSPPPELTNDLDAQINANLSDETDEESDDQADEQFYLEPIE